MGAYPTRGTPRRYVILTAHVPKVREPRAGLASQGVNVGFRGGAVEFSGKLPDMKEKHHPPPPPASMGGSSH